MPTSFGVRLFREPDAGNLPVRFDEREQETEPGQTGLRRARRKPRPIATGRLKPLRLFSTLLSLVLKNSVSAPNGQILGDRKCLAIREDRLYRILAQFHFCDFCRNEFFNSHGI
jgi:hypothetical protein